MKKTAKLSSAPGCIGSPTMRSLKHPMCDTCVFRTACLKLSTYYAKEFSDIIAPEYLRDPAENRISTPADQFNKGPTGDSLSENSKALLKDLNSTGYNKILLRDLLKTNCKDSRPGRTFTWVIPALQAIRSGCGIGDLKDIIKAAGINGSVAHAKAMQFTAILAHYGFVRREPETGQYKYISTGDDA